MGGWRLAGSVNECLGEAMGRQTGRGEELVLPHPQLGKRSGENGTEKVCLLFQELRTRMGMEKDPRRVSLSLELPLLLRAGHRDGEENHRTGQSHVCWRFE